MKHKELTVIRLLVALIVFVGSSGSYNEHGGELAWYDYSYSQNAYDIGRDVQWLAYDSNNYDHYAYDGSYGVYHHNRQNSHYEQRSRQYSYPSDSGAWRNVDYPSVVYSTVGRYGKQFSSNYGTYQPSTAWEWTSYPSNVLQRNAYEDRTRYGFGSI